MIDNTWTFNMLCQIEIGNYLGGAGRQFWKILFFSEDKKTERNFLKNCTYEKLIPHLTLRWVIKYAFLPQDMTSKMLLNFIRRFIAILFLNVMIFYYFAWSEKWFQYFFSIYSNVRGKFTYRLAGDKVIPGNSLY
jgi:hypothetical protein